MKFLHISDLHLGKKVHGYSMLDDQRHMLQQLARIAAEKEVDGVLVAGDVYDKTIPPVEAVALLDAFMTDLSGNGIAVYLISGNHDSPERLDFASRILCRHQVHIAGDFSGSLQPITVQDEHGPVNLFLLPYLRPSVLSRMLGQKASFQECVDEVLAQTDVNTSQRNILVAHQFVLCGTHLPEASDSEVKTLGGVDHLDASLFDAFDYVALGHIHKPQPMGRETLRYCGSPLKYSFSEAKTPKQAVIMDLQAKGNITLDFVPLRPARDMLEWAGSLQELQTRSCYDAAPKDSYMHITLTDDAEIIDAIGKVREVYPYVMLLDFANRRFAEAVDNTLSNEDIQQKTPLELFDGFFELQNGLPMTAAQAQAFQRTAQEREVPHEA